MAEKTVDVSVEFFAEEFDTYELIDELENRLDESTVQEFIKNNCIDTISNNSLDKEMKLEYLMKVIDKYTLSQIEELLP